jgi:hypothetical protein
MEEWNQYITGLKSGVEMAECFRNHFNTTQNWSELTNDVTTSVWSNAEFRYFILRYVITARNKHPDVYSKIATGQEIRQCYTYLVQFAEQTMAEWIAILKSRNLDTLTRNGFDWHWKYWNEIQKQEYKDLEKILILPSTPIVRHDRNPSTPGWVADAGMGVLFDLRGRAVRRAKAVPGAYILRPETGDRVLRVRPLR